MSNIKNISFLLILSILISSVVWALYPSNNASAQINPNIWTDPINLSKSGGTSNPVVVVDKEGKIHVVWHDSFVGTVYTGFVDGVWTVPRAVQLPWSPSPLSLNPGETLLPGPTPNLISDQTGNIYAFWVNEQNQLFSSYVPSKSFGDPTSWSIPSQIAESAIDFDTLVDSQGNIHLIYIRGISGGGFQSGVYYRTSNDRGSSWGPAILLYESPYFRNISNNDVNVDIATATDQGTVTLFASWDNRTRRQVYFTYSVDGGRNWEQPQVIEGPTENNPIARPSNIQVVNHNDNLLLFWQDGDATINCTQYFNVSSDGGKSWGDRRTMFAEISGCPQDIQFFSQDNLLIMMTNIQGQVYLVAWDGSQWSKLQPQRELMGFLDPDTFDQVIFGCRQAAQDTTNGHLVVVGCDTGRGGDIWFTQRSIGDISEWFPPPSAWTEPEVVTTTDTPITYSMMLSDSKGRMHAFWIQPQTTASTGTPSTNVRDAIYYSRGENDQWTRPVAVLQSPSGMTRQPAIAVDRNDNLYVVWSGGEGGEIYFSRATGARANSPSEWIEPLLLPSVRQAGISPDIQVDVDGAIHVVYAIPLNENRGIYVTESKDGGVSWSEPVQAFNAIQEGWEMVDKPHIAISGNSVINIVFENLSLPGGSGSKGLYANRSDDRGVTWSEVKTVTARSVAWNKLIRAPNGSLHRVWVEQSGFGTLFQHEVSKDFGASWEAPVSISTIDTSQGDPAITFDSAGQLYLIQVIEDTSQRLSLANWLWDGSRWTVQESLDLGNSTNLVVQGASAAVSPDGRLSVIFTAYSKDLTTDIPTYWIYTTERVLELPSMLPTPMPEPVLELTETPVVENLVLPSPTPTMILPALPIKSQGGSLATQSNTWFGLAIAGVLGVLIVGAVFVVRLLKLRK